MGRSARGAVISPVSMPTFGCDGSRFPTNSYNTTPKQFPLNQLNYKSLIMSNRLRRPSLSHAHEEITPRKSHGNSKGRYRYIEFKYLYFQIQQQINKDVVLSFKYEQLKTPEIRISVIKPLVSKIVDLSSIQSLRNAFSNQLVTTPGSMAFETPQFGPVGYGALPLIENSTSKISTCVIYVLLLLRYEYMIQSENNLIMYDLLLTKSTICEFLAIRMLREYSSTERINLLFINPMAHHEEHVQLKHTKHLDSFNTLELSILSKSKKFLIQPVIIGILDRIYNGELIMKDKNANRPANLPQDSIPSTSTDRDLEESYLTAKRTLAPDFETGQAENNGLSTPESEDFEKRVVNYKFNQTTLKKVFTRSNVVPKYQSLVINLKYGFLTVLFLILVFKHKYKYSPDFMGTNPAFSILFWIVALSFNLDVIVKLLHIEFRFLKKIIWTYIDILIVTLIDISFVMRLLLGFGKIYSQTYYNCFSLISILLFPRMLSVFNNYEFFNMMIVSLKKMSWNVIALFCLFTSLIFGFFLCFISLTIDLSTYEVAFAMVKIFFGFTPAVWDNWESFDNLGRALQLAFLSLIQFVLTTILAIVLSNVFAKVSETNKEEFEYLKTTNLIIYLKWASFQSPSRKVRRLTIVFDNVVKISKFPIILIIYFYEILIKENKKLLQKQRKDLKHFTFLNREDDLYGDTDMLLLTQLADEEDVSSLRLSSRRGSQGDPRVVPGGDANVAFATHANNGTHDILPRKKLIPRNLIPQQSQATMGGFRSGSLDSMFIDDFLGKRYGAGRRRNASELRSRRIQSEAESKAEYQKSNEMLMVKLRELEDMLLQLVNTRTETDDKETSDYVVHTYTRDEDDPKLLDESCEENESIDEDDEEEDEESIMDGGEHDSGDIFPHLSVH
ncbi:hypothetical protein JCM33374_g132 [Metschnikowia sp. JCM 33374]|nr:hypothetical protein JCM33374_g132 [Metschnikowia sp. JCM 33374]